MKKILLTSLLLCIFNGCSTAKKASIIPAQVALIPVGIVDAVIGTSMAKSANSSLQEFANSKDPQKKYLEQNKKTNSATAHSEQMQQNKPIPVTASPSDDIYINNDFPTGINKLDESAVIFEVDNKFTQEQIAKAKGLTWRGKELVKEMKIKIRATMKNRPSNNNYKVKVKILQLAKYDCNVKRKTSMQVRCPPVEDDNEIGTKEILLTKERKWSTSFEIGSRVAVSAVKEDWVAIYEVELKKLDIEPKVENIEVIN